VVGTSRSQDAKNVQASRPPSSETSRDAAETTRSTDMSQTLRDRFVPAKAVRGFKMMSTYAAQTGSSEEITFGPFRLYPQWRLLLRADAPLRLGSRARELLLILVDNAGEVVKKSELLARVWPDTIVEAACLRVHISALRRALGDGQADMCYVENVTGHGYRFIAPLRRVKDSPPPVVTRARTLEHTRKVLSSSGTHQASVSSLRTASR